MKEGNEAQKKKASAARFSIFTFPISIFYRYPSASSASCTVA